MDYLGPVYQGVHCPPTPPGYTPHRHLHVTMCSRTSLGRVTAVPLREERRLPWAEYSPLREERKLPWAEYSSLRRRGGYPLGRVLFPRRREVTTLGRVLFPRRKEVTLRAVPGPAFAIFLLKTVLNLVRFRHLLHFILSAGEVPDLF